MSEARQGFVTSLTEHRYQFHPPSLPLETVFRLVRYRSPAGGLPAYVSPAPPPGEPLRPAIIWVAGEYARTIGPECWEEREKPSPTLPLQEAGLFLMLPSLRGGHDHTGLPEGFYGEVDDVLAAARELSRRRGIDPRRIYLAGHSTGGTLALLTAECSDFFRAVFCLGPVDDLRVYGSSHLPFHHEDPREWELRTPGRWLSGLRTPTFIFEGAHHANVHSFRALESTPHPDCLTFHLAAQSDHYSVIPPVLALIARKIGEDTDPDKPLTISAPEFAAAMGG